MTTLRVLLAAPVAASRADAWALFDDQGKYLRRGQDVPSAWPDANRREAVLAASLVRVVSLALPPMPPARIAAAAAFALEDQLATTGEPPVIAVSAARADGSVLATVASRAVVASLATHRPPFERVIAEPAVAPVQTGWTWYASGTDGGFVRRADGATFSVDAPDAATIPPELASALAQSARSGSAPSSVSVAHPCTDEALDAWSRNTGVRFVRAAAWRWEQAGAPAFDAASDLLEREFARRPVAAPRSIARLFRPALAIAALALGLHVAATIGEWLWLKVDAWRVSRSFVALAQEAGLPDTSSADAALRGIARRHAELRHRAGLFAPSDALPLLARAAPAFASIPPNALKSATYSDGAWTVELGPLDARALAALDRGLANAGVTALQAKTSAGYRVRVTGSL